MFYSSQLVQGFLSNSRESVFWEDLLSVIFGIADHFLMLRILSIRHHPIQNVNSLMTCFLSSIVGSLFGQGANIFFKSEGHDLGC